MKNHTNSVTLELRIDWSELDYFGHVNNVAFFKYIQAARVNYWEAIGLSAYHVEKNIGPMLVSCQCDFKKPLFFPGQVYIESRIHFIKTTSFSIEHTLFNADNEVVAEAKDIIVLFDYNHQVKFAIPDSLKLAIADLDKH